MANVRSIRAILLTLLLSLSLFQLSCTVFGTVGGWFSRGYENTVAYFNAYYNAKRLFDDAEAEVLAARAAAAVRTTPVVPAPAGGSSTKQKFTAVIDKCSNILSFYPESSIVEDALFLIGKSYYYQEEYVKAERKFTELIAKDPNGSLSLESQLWLLKSLRHLRRYDEAQTIGTQLASNALTAGEESIAGEAYSILGEMASEQNNVDVAIDAYTKSVNAFDNGAMKAATQSRVGDLYYSLQDYSKASAAYLDVQKYSPDTYGLYHSQLRAALCERFLGQYDAALELLRRMESDYRFIDYRSTIQFELGQTLDLGGHPDQAVEIYALVDSVYSRTEQGARAAFELGKLLQYRLDDYAGAKRAYTHATTGGPADLTGEAQKKVAGLDKYFSLQGEFSRADSILFVLDIDSVWIKRDSTGNPIMKGSLTGKVDSLKKPSPDLALTTPRDTSTSMKKPTTTPAPREGPGPYQYLPRPPKDTLIAQMGRYSYQLGELFYTELEVPDSTFYWMRQAMEFNLDSTRIPRALYVLAEVAHADTTKRFGDARELYERIIDEYPKSTYAEEARVALGQPRTVRHGDPAIPAYAVADSLVEAGEYGPAIDSLAHLVRAYSNSPLVPKSYYMMAWIYENGLKLPDSAIAQYRTIAQRFTKTEYGEAALRRIPPAEPAPETKKDTSAILAPGKAEAVHPDSVKAVVRDSVRKPVGALVNDLEPDTAKVRSLVKPTYADTSGRIFDIDRREKKAVVTDTLHSQKAKKVIEK